MPSARLFWLNHTSVRRRSKCMTGILSGASIFGSPYVVVSSLFPLPFSGRSRYISRQPIIAAIDARSCGTKGQVTKQETWYATWRRKHSRTNSNSRSKTRPLEVTATGKWGDLFFPIFTCQADSVKGREIWKPKNKIFMSQGKHHSVTMS